MQLLIFAGTTEGRELVETLLARGETNLTVCVATEYGGALLPETNGLQVLVGRLGQPAMECLLRERAVTHVVDATHPYAVEASRNICGACASANVPYLRLTRESERVSQGVEVTTVAEAAAFLNTVTGNVLVTTGSKELAAFTVVEDYETRLFVRVLPVPDALAHCHTLGFPARNIIAMQGPFSEELNTAVLRQVNAKWLVTKESGTAGGFAEKCRAARNAGAHVVLVGRPLECGGLSLKQVLEKLFPEQKPQSVVEKYFPMFVPLTNKHAVVFGAGNIAKRRVRALLEFGCRITLIAPKNTLPEHPRLRWLARGYQPGDACGADFVLAASSDRAVNHAVFEECRKAGVPVNVADRKEECDFYFPALIQRGAVVIGVTASGTDHICAAKTAANIRALQDAIFQTEGGTPCSEPSE